MSDTFTFTQFLSRFPSDDLCLDEVKKLRYPTGIHCRICKKKTKHYRITDRTAYACQFCRNQIYPLADTLFAKSTTPLRIWFCALFLMTQTKSTLSAKQLQRELGVTYKTAWRMQKEIKSLMAQHNGDLLSETDKSNKVRKWTFFNKFQITVVEKKEKQ